MNREVGRAAAHGLWSGLEAEFDRYRESVSYIPITKLRLQEDLRRYLCLRCAGFLEQVTFVILHGYLEQKVSGPAHSFASSWFERAPNLGVDAFVKLIGRFGSDRKSEFELFLTKVRRQTLGDLLDVRNSVAHGEISTGQKLDPARYFDLCEEIYDWLVDSFLGNSVAVIDDDGYTVVGFERTPS